MRISVITLLAATLLAACADGDEDIAVPVTPEPLPTAPPPTFSQVFSQVLEARCQSCHGTPTGVGITEGKLDLSSQPIAYANLVGVAAAGTACAGQGTRVVPGNAPGSLLVLKVSLDDPAPCGGKMPLDAAPLTRDQTNLIAGWINAGALDD
jgi:hypothetical protein